MNYLVPDKVGEPRIAWRAWRLIHAPGENLSLASINWRPDKLGAFYWRPREVMKAICSGGSVTHWQRDVPYEGCTCGLYAMDSNISLAYTPYVSFIGEKAENIVWGEISVWGKIIEGETGLKSQFAYPNHLYIRTDMEVVCGPLHYLKGEQLREMLSEQWGIPVSFAETISRETPKDKVATLLPPATDTV